MLVSMSFSWPLEQQASLPLDAVKMEMHMNGMIWKREGVLRRNFD